MQSILNFEDFHIHIQNWGGIGLSSPQRERGIAFSSQFSESLNRGCQAHNSKLVSLRHHRKNKHHELLRCRLIALDRAFPSMLWIHHFQLEASNYHFSLFPSALWSGCFDYLYQRNYPEEWYLSWHEICEWTTSSFGGCNHQGPLWERSWSEGRWPQWWWLAW